MSSDEQVKRIIQRKAGLAITKNSHHLLPPVWVIIALMALGYFALIALAWRTFC